MITTLIRNYKRVLREYRSAKILNKIGSGKRVFFENPLEGIAFKYIPGEIGKLSKYYVRHYGEEEYEIDSNSSCILSGVLEGKPINSLKYDNYDYIEEVSWNSSTYKTPIKCKAMGS